MLKDRFHAQWDQPTSIYEANNAFITTVSIRIEPDGTISRATVVRSSGNAVMDQSVQVALNRVKKVPPVPKEMAKGAYEIRINFELE